MAISLFDFTKGIDFTALTSATAADHNSLVDGGVPYVTDKGIVMVSNDTALNTPDVPNAAATTKWKNYIWIRRPHSTATNTTPIAYMWNENAVSVATYLKWQRIPADTSTVDAALAALTLRVEDLEAVNVTLQALVNAANSNATLAKENADAALSTANAANANALTALSDLNTPTTGVKDRVTALETRITAAEASITAINIAITAINTTLGSGLGPQFVAPVLLYSGTAGFAYATLVLAIPSTCKAIILQLDGEHNADATILGRKNAASSSYTLLHLKTNDGARPAYRSNQAIVPCTTTGFDLFMPATSGTTTVQMIGYIL